MDFYILQLRGEPFLPWDLMQVSEAAGVASRSGHPRPEEHGRPRRRGAGSDRRLLLPLPGASEAALGAASGGFAASTAATCAPHLRGVFAACRHPVAGHPARRMDAGPLLPLLRRHHQLPHQPDRSGNRQARGLLRSEAINAILDDVEAGRSTPPARPGPAPTPPRPRQTNEKNPPSST